MNDDVNPKPLEDKREKSCDAVQGNGKSPGGGSGHNLYPYNGKGPKWYQTPWRSQAKGKGKGKKGRRFNKGQGGTKGNRKGTNGHYRSWKKVENDGKGKNTGQQNTWRGGQTNLNWNKPSHQQYQQSTHERAQKPIPPTKRRNERKRQRLMEWRKMVTKDKQNEDKKAIRFFNKIIGGMTLQDLQCMMNFECMYEKYICTTGLRDPCSDPHRKPCLGQ